MPSEHSAPAPAPPDVPDDSAPARARERLIAALLDNAGELGGRCLLHAYAAGGVLLTAADGGVLLLFLTVPAAATPEQMRELFAANLKGNDAREFELHVVAVGGGGEVAERLKDSVPPGYSTRLGLHHLDASGNLVHVHEHRGARRLSVLDEALGRRQVTPLTRAQIDAALAESRAQQARFVAATNLGGGFRVTATITVACVVLMGLELWWMSAGELAVFAAMGANSGVAVREGEIWRLFASAFLHGNIIHLVVNMLALWSFGPVLESLLGPRRFVLLYGISALGGSLASAFLGSGVWSVGASGAIWGLMAAGLGIAFWPRGLLPPPVVEQMRKKAWMPLILNVGYSLQPGIDILAHLGGGVVGFALSAACLTRGLKPLAERAHPADVERAPSPANARAAVAIGLAMALSVAVALAKGRPWELNAPLVFQRTALGETGFTVELPDRIAKHLKIEQHGAVPVFAFGNFPESPVAFEFVASELPPEVRTQDVETTLEQLRAVANLVSPPEFTRVAPAERVTVAGHPAVRVDYTLNDVSMRTYMFVLRGHEVLMRCYTLGQLPQAWVGAEERVAASLLQP